MDAHRRAHRAYPRRPRVDHPGMRGRARADAWPLIVAVGVIALTSLLASATPRLVDRTADAALRDSLASTGLHTELAVTVPIVENAYQPRTLEEDLATHVDDRGAALVAARPAELTGVLAAPVATVTTTPLPMTLGRTDLGAVTMTFAYIARGGEPRVRWLDGGPPTAAPVTPAGL